VSAVRDLLHDYQHVIEEVRVRMGEKGVFDVEVDGTLIYSKKVEGRHAQPGEVLARFKQHIGPDFPVYER